MGTSYSWAETRERAAEQFGGTWPDAQLENQIIEHFRERPAFVVDAIADVANAYQGGRVRAPWPFLRKRLNESPADVVVQDTGERDRAVSRAQQWLRAAGLHLDRESEVEEELFGERGFIRSVSAGERLHGELLGLWRELAPTGAALEREADERMAHWRETQAKLATAGPRDSYAAFGGEQQAAPDSERPAVDDWATE